jgi:hypothetical protein
MYRQFYHHTYTHTYQIIISEGIMVNDSNGHQLGINRNLPLELLIPHWVHVLMYDAGLKHLILHILHVDNTVRVDAVENIHLGQIHSLLNGKIQMKVLRIVISC